MPKFKGNIMYLNPFYVPAQSFTMLQIFCKFIWTPSSFGGDLNPTNEHIPKFFILPSALTSSSFLKVILNRRLNSY